MPGLNQNNSTSEDYGWISGTFASMGALILAGDAIYYFSKSLAASLNGKDAEFNDAAKDIAIVGTVLLVIAVFLAGALKAHEKVQAAKSNYSNQLKSGLLRPPSQAAVNSNGYELIEQGQGSAPELN